MRFLFIDFLLNARHSFRLYTLFYFENFINLEAFMLRKSSNGSAVEADWPVLWADGPVPGYSVSDTGGYKDAFFLAIC